MKARPEKIKHRLVESPTKTHTMEDFESRMEKAAELRTSILTAKATTIAAQRRQAAAALQAKGKEEARANAEKLVATMAAVDERRAAVLKAKANPPSLKRRMVESPKNLLMCAEWPALSKPAVTIEDYEKKLARAEEQRQAAIAAKAKPEKIKHRLVESPTKAYTMEDFEAGIDAAEARRAAKVAERLAHCEAEQKRVTQAKARQMEMRQQLVQAVAKAEAAAVKRLEERRRQIGRASCTERV